MVFASRSVSVQDQPAVQVNAQEANIHRMKGDSVDRPNMLFIFIRVLVLDRLSMTFEGILLFLSLRVRIEELHGYSTLDRTNRIS